MQNSQPDRTTQFRHLRAGDVEELEAAQPEKRRGYLQLGKGPFTGELTELRLPALQLFRECLDVGVRIEAAPLPQLVPFALTIDVSAPASFCGEDLPPNTFVQAGGGAWESNLSRAMDYVCWVFDRERFDQTTLDLLGRPAPAAWFQSRVRPASREATGSLGRGLVRLLEDSEKLPAPVTGEASRGLEANLMERTIALLCSSEEEPYLQPGWRRRRALRRALERLEAEEEPTPTIPELCRWAGVSQRTLEYAFRDELGVTPVRYLKILRLNRAHRLLRQATRGTETVTGIALACGFIELGRFAAEYRRLFGESPSQTLARD
jgi:AraC family ethanolamine operon transcriptional activator